MADPIEIQRLLVANRGEIARRVFRTARRLNIETVAVFAEPDRYSAHVRDADLAVALGGTSSAESYLDIDKILNAARLANADAIHPGYGFLAENPVFAERVETAGLIWVGPRPESIRAMAGKVQAKELAAAAGVPLVPGAQLDSTAQAQLVGAAEAPIGSSPAVGVDAASVADPANSTNLQSLLSTAAKVGYPLLVKASAGGGGKGMRLVESETKLVAAVTAARREALASFGDPTVFLERYLPNAHHIEIQVFGDTHGNIVHLFERECSIQRRHQKIIEECPSPNVNPTILANMTAAATALAESIGYVGAGTVEFLVTETASAVTGPASAVTGTSEAVTKNSPANSPARSAALSPAPNTTLGPAQEPAPNPTLGPAQEPAQCPTQEFFFLEMNTRLQVEHPVTEMALAPAIDLVEWQLRVATGEPLPLDQDQITRSGIHAIEARIYAEDPARDFLPSTGTLVAFDAGAGPGGTGPNYPRSEIRNELSVEPGDSVTPHYDPMIAKIVAAAPTRDQATAELATALAAWDIAGIVTNRDALVAILRDPDFRAGQTPTRFIDDHPQLLTSTPEEAVWKPHLIAAALAVSEIEAAGWPWRQFVPLGWRNVPAVPARSDWAFNARGTTYQTAVLIDWREPGSAILSVQTADATPKTGSPKTGSSQNPAPPHANTSPIPGANPTGLQSHSAAGQIQSAAAGPTPASNQQEPIASRARLLNPDPPIKPSSAALESTLAALSSSHIPPPLTHYQVQLVSPVSGPPTSPTSTSFQTLADSELRPWKATTSTPDFNRYSAPSKNGPIGGSDFNRYSAIVASATVYSATVYSAIVASAIVASAIVELEVGQVRRRYRVGIAGEWAWVNDGRTSTTFQRLPRFLPPSETAVGAGPTAPVPGTIVAVEVAPGELVAEGQTLVVLEAMKMEHRINASTAGIVESVLVRAGQAVDAHQLLVELQPRD